MLDRHTDQIHRVFFSKIDKTKEKTVYIHASNIQMFVQAIQAHVEANTEKRPFDIHCNMTRGVIYHGNKSIGRFTSIRHWLPITRVDGVVPLNEQCQCTDPRDPSKAVYHKECPMHGIFVDHPQPWDQSQEESVF